MVEVVTKSWRQWHQKKRKTSKPRETQKQRKIVARPWASIPSQSANDETRDTHHVHASVFHYAHPYAPRAHDYFPYSTGKAHVST
eukprot:9719838-Ditylum_brightwellii.AAC.2